MSSYGRPPFEDSAVHVQHTHDVEPGGEPKVIGVHADILCGPNVQ